MQKPKKKGDLTKDRILAEAISHFAKHGYDQASLHEIAKTCKVTHVALLYHFESKQGLFLSVVEFVMTRCHALVSANTDKNDDAHQRLVKYFQGFLTWSVIYRGEAQILLLLAYFAAIGSEFAERYAKIVEGELEKLETMLLAGQREGKFGFSDSPSLIAKTILDSLFGMIMNGLAQRTNSPSPKVTREKLDVLIDSLVIHGRPRAKAK